MEAKFIEHNNQRILYVDYRGAKTEEDILSLLKIGIRLKREAGEGVNLMLNYQNVFFTKKICGTG